MQHPVWLHRGADVAPFETKSSHHHFTPQCLINSLLHGLPSVLHLQAPNTCKIKVAYPPVNIPLKFELDVSNLFFLFSPSAGTLLARGLHSQALKICWKQGACTKTTHSRQVLPLLYSRSGKSPTAQNVKSRGLAD